MNKILTIAALALVLSACSNEDNDIQTPVEQPAKSEGIPFTATISIGESASTRALAEDEVNKKIVATWETGEKVALIYDAGGTPTKTDAEVTKQADGTATISATLESGATNGSDVTIIYPATAVDPTTRDVAANLLAAQDGTLTGTGGTSIAEKYDVRKGTGKLNINDGKATVNNGTAGTTVSLTNQNAIFKLTLKDIDGTSDVSSTSVIISDENGVVTTVTPASGYEKAMYVALPTTATTLKFLVTGSDSKKYFNMASGFTLGANYYQSTIKLATIGNVIASNGKCYKNKAATPGGNTAVAMIAYLGNESNCSNGLAAAMEDTKSEYGLEPMYLSEANAVCSNLNTSLPITGGTWRLPSVTDFQYMIISCGSGQSYSDPWNEMTKNFQALADMLGAAGGSNYMENTNYFTRYGNPFVWILNFSYDDFEAEFTLVDDHVDAFARACLAF